MKMLCDKKYGELGSGIAWETCMGELKINRFYDDTESVLFSKSVCTKCGQSHTGIIWQR